MAGIIVLAAFAAILFICVALDISMLTALLAGFMLFFCYGLLKGHSLREMAKMSVLGIKTIKTLLITFLLIGIITTVWRSGGTIAYIVYYAMEVCDPRFMVLISFLLCGSISFLTGTAFGTAATMGVICATVSGSMGVPMLYVGGAVLAGSYFGDRCSPMSTSAMLVTALTKTDIFKNISTMVKTSLVPFVISCGIYLVMGRGVSSSFDVSDMQRLFENNFVLKPIVLLPAAAILILALLKVKVKTAMVVSAVCGIIVSLLVQKMSVTDLLSSLVMGYSPSDPDIFALFSGGGLLSMLKTTLIVCISASYSGIFNGTGLLNGIRDVLMKLSVRITPFAGMFVTSVITGMIACNQTLCIMLTHQLCRDVEKDNYVMASYLEDTAVVVAPLIPWSIAGAVPLATVGAPLAGIAAACYLYILPLWNLAVNLVKKKRA